jgi:hypothetical protein
MIVGLFHEIDEGIHYDGREGHKSLASDPERETWRCVVPGGAEGI